MKILDNEQFWAVLRDGLRLSETPADADADLKVIVNDAGRILGVVVADRTDSADQVTRAIDEYRQLRGEVKGYA